MVEDFGKYITPGKIVTEEVIVKYTKVISKEAPQVNFSANADYNANINVKLGTEKIEFKSGFNGKLVENTVKYSKDKTTLGDVVKLFGKIVMSKLGKKTNGVEINYQGLSPEVMAEAENVKNQYNKVLSQYFVQIDSLPIEVPLEAIRTETTVTSQGIVETKPLEDRL